MVWKTLAHVEARVAASKPGVANSGVLSKRGWPEQTGEGLGRKEGRKARVSEGVSE